MSDQDAGDEASRDDPLLDRLEAHFPTEVFEPIARALWKNADRPDLEALRERLLPEFCSFYSSCTTDKRFRTERGRELTDRSKAAAALLSSLQSRWFLDQPRDLLDGAFRRRFTAVLEKLADPARIGPKKRHRPNDAFRNDLIPGLIWAYEHIAGERAGKPYPLRDDPGYGGPFYRFVCAVRACLYDHLPEVRGCLLASEGALAEELKHHWHEDRKLTG
jgi:hypothetical protein